MPSCPAPRCKWDQSYSKKRCEALFNQESCQSTPKYCNASFTSNNPTDGAFMRLCEQYCCTISWIVYVVIVAVAVGILLLLGIGAFCLIRRRRGSRIDAARIGRAVASTSNGARLSATAQGHSATEAEVLKTDSGQGKSLDRSNMDGNVSSYDVFLGVECAAGSSSKGTIKMTTCTDPCSATAGSRLRASMPPLPPADSSSYRHTLPLSSAYARDTVNSDEDDEDTFSDPEERCYRPVPTVSSKPEEEQSSRGNDGNVFTGAQPGVRQDQLRVLVETDSNLAAATIQPDPPLRVTIHTPTTTSVPAVFHKEQVPQRQRRERSALYDNRGHLRVVSNISDYVDTSGNWD